MKKTISIMVILCMIFGMTINSFALDTDKLTEKINDVKVATAEVAEVVIEEAVKKLSDIANHWAKKFIQVLTDKGIIGGYPDGTFRPDNPIKVTEFTVLALKAKGIDIPKTDVWYQGVIDEASELGYIKTGEYNNYDTRLINRGEMARIIVRVLEEKESTGTTKFNDDHKIPSNLKGYIKRANELGIINGYPDNTFKWDGKATRAEASTMISKMLEIIENGVIEPVEPSEPNEPDKPATDEIKDITEFPRENLESVVNGKGFFEYGIGFDYYRSTNLYRVKLEDLPISMGDNIIYGVERKVEKVNKRHAFIVYQMSKRLPDINRRGSLNLNINVANADYSVLRQRNPQDWYKPSDVTYDSSGAIKYFKTYYDTTGIYDEFELKLDNWWKYKGEDAKHIFFYNTEIDAVVLIEDALN